MGHRGISGGRIPTLNKQKRIRSRFGKILQAAMPIRWRNAGHLYKDGPCEDASGNRIDKRDLLRLQRCGFIEDVTAPTDDDAVYDLTDKGRELLKNHEVAEAPNG